MFRVELKASYHPNPQLKHYEGSGGRAGDIKSSHSSKETDGKANLTLKLF